MLFLAGAIAASPGTGLAQPDLEIVRGWLAGSNIEHMPTGRGHLAKPGYLLFLRIMLPQGGASERELRRLLFFNALWTWTGVTALCLVLWRRVWPGAAVAVAALTLLYVPIRDATDWLVTEPLAVGFSLFFAAALVALPPKSLFGSAGLGGVSAFLLLIRPNVSYALLLIAIIFFASAGDGRWRRSGALLLGFAAGIVLLAGLARITGLPVDPRAVSPSTPLLFGTAEYGWPLDESKWPSGWTPKETEQLELQAARSHWLHFFRRFGPDERRSLLWRLTHPIASVDQFPSRWQQPRYMSINKLVRRWWWIAGILLSAAAMVCAIGSRSGWRFVPVLIVVVLAVQGFLFAETRFGLPLWPLFFLALTLALRAIRPPMQAWLAGVASVAVFVAVVHRVPDTVASDFAIATHPGDVIRQHVPRSRFRGTEPRLVHLRVLASPRNVGLEIRGNREVLLRRSPGDDSPYPPFLTLALSGRALERAQRDGVELEVRSLGDPAGQGFLYFPVVPGLFGSTATLNGSETLPSGFGGTTRGAFPVWTHVGPDTAVDTAPGKPL